MSPLMDSVREEVLAKLIGFERDWMKGESFSVLLCAVIEARLELEQDPDSDTGWHEDVEAECDATLNALTDAIMSAFKRGAGVVVSPLVWEKIGAEVWFARNGLGGTYQIEFDEGWQRYRAMLNTAGETLEVGSPFDTLEAAKASCQADYAKRITSAVEPSCVVTDENSQELIATIVYEAMRWAARQGQTDTPSWEPRGNSHAQNRARQAASVILTAALSSRTEEEREVPAYVRERADEETAQIKASIGRDEPTVTVEIHGGEIAGVDESIAPLVKLLNDGGIATVASCSGHGQRPGNIALEDGRELIIARNWNEARLIDGLFPGINGEPAKGIEGALEFIRQSSEEIRAAVIEELNAAADGRSVVTPKRGKITILGSGGGECEPLTDWIARSLTKGEG